MIGRPTVPPTVEHRDRPLDETVERHPAFGMVNASRMTGRFILHGSDFEHRSVIALRISHARLTRTLSTDWHSAENEIIEVLLSEAQWATFLSTMNHGQGAPCTIEHIEREYMPHLPLRDAREVADAEATALALALGAEVQKAREAVERELGPLSQIRRDKILAHLKSIERRLTDSLPFMVKQFGEHTETVTERAKIEVAAYIANAVTRAGLGVLTGEAPLTLSAGPSTEETIDDE